MSEYFDTLPQSFNWAFLLLEDVLPKSSALALAFGLGNLLVATFFRIAFGGRLKMPLRGVNKNAG